MSRKTHIAHRPSYVKPEMQTVYFQHQPQLIVTSAQGEDINWNPSGIDGGDR
jgi:hypothetical protein